MIPHLQAGGRRTPWPPFSVGSDLLGYHAVMLRFHEGEHVLVRSFMGKDCNPLKTGVVQKLFGSGSILYDYLVCVDGSNWPVRDPWLASSDYTIVEVLDLHEICTAPGAIA